MTTGRINQGASCVRPLSLVREGDARPSSQRDVRASGKAAQLRLRRSRRRASARRRVSFNAAGLVEPVDDTPRRIGTNCVICTNRVLLKRSCVVKVLILP